MKCSNESYRYGVFVSKKFVMHKKKKQGIKPCQITAEPCISSDQRSGYHQHEVLYIIIAKENTAYG